MVKLEVDRIEIELSPLYNVNLISEESKTVFIRILELINFINDSSINSKYRQLISFETNYTRRN